MLGEKGDYSILQYAGLIIVFIMLAVIGSYAIITMIGNPASGNVFPGPENITHSGYGVNYLNDSLQVIDFSRPQYANNGNFSGAFALFTFGNYTASFQWLTMTFIDYKLTPIYYNGDLEKCHMVAFQSPGPYNVSFQLTGLQNGTHDVVFLDLFDPYCLMGNDTRYRDIVGPRFNLIAGNASASTVQYNAGPSEQFVTYKNNSSINVMDDGPWLTAKPFFVDESVAGVRPPTDAIGYINATPGDDIEYYIDVRNGAGPGNGYNSKFAVMQLLDYEQMPLRHDMSEDVYFGALNPGQTLALHANIIAPKIPGKHILSIICATNPDGESSTCHLRQVIINVAP